MRYFLMLLLIPLTVFADDSWYERVRDNDFWPTLYNRDYVTLYCGLQRQAGQRVSVEHVYSADWIAEAVGCENRNDCPFDEYRDPSSDLHNLWPALQRYNSSRGDRPFGEIEGNTPRFPEDNCDYERTTGSQAIVEPRDSVKGDIARSILYMIYWYDFPDQDLLPLLIRWHNQDPPDAEERRRNDAIEEIQWNRNPFIDTD